MHISYFQEKSLQSAKKSSNGTATRDANEGTKDHSLLVYSSLLRNEILGAQIEDFKELSNAQESSNNWYKSHDGLNQKAVTLISNLFSNPTLNQISSITSSLDNDLYHMSFTQEELMETKFPHNMSRDIDMDPCKSGIILL